MLSAKRSRHRIPIALVAKVETDKVTLNASRDEIGRLAPVPVARP